MSKKKKGLLKAAALVMALAMAIMAFAGCGSQNNNPSGTTAAQQTASTAQSSQEPATAAEKKDPFGPLPEKTALEIFKYEPVGITFPEGDTLLENRYVKTFGEKLNIDYKFPVVMKSGGAADDKIKLMIASDDLLDVTIVSYNLFAQMLKSDMLEDLAGAYDQYASEAVKTCYGSDGGKSLEAVTRDGKLYGLPTMGSDHNADSLVWLRQDWLDKLKLAPPATIDELAVVLKAFIEQDPDGNGKPDTVGLAGQESFVNEVAQTFAYDGIFDIYKAYAKTWQKASDGTYVYGSIMPQTKDALGKLREMYSQGILTRDFAISKSDQAAELVNTNKCGAFFGPWWSGWFPLTDVVKNIPDGEWKAYAIKGIDGTYSAKQESPAGSVAVLKKGYKYPEALIKSVNMYYQIQQSDPSLVGGDPYEGLPLPDWTLCPVALGLWRADSVIRDHMCMTAASRNEAYPYNDVPSGMDKYYKDVAALWNKGVDWLKQNPDNFGDPFSRFIGVQPIVDANIQPVYNAYASTTETMAKKKANLDKLEVQSMLSIIVGDKPLDSFDEFVASWKSMGGDEITKEVNDALK